MVDINISEMMEAGAHFGHQTRRWNPKMKPYLYGSRSGVHIIDLQKTFTLGQTALNFIVNTVARGEEILFVGTKAQARDILRAEAERSQMFYVNNRWMGGTLTNYQTIKKSINRLIDYETRRANNGFEGYTKRELLDIDRAVIKLTASLGGIKNMSQLPGAIFVIDPSHENIAVSEAQKLGIPVVAMVDSNCNPDQVDYVIPCNDDAISSITYMVSKIADACLEGLAKREERAQSGVDLPKKAARPRTAAKEDDNRGQRHKKRGPGGRDARKTEPRDKSAYVAKSVKEQPAAEEAAQGGFSAKVTPQDDATKVS